MWLKMKSISFWMLTLSPKSRGDLFSYFSPTLPRTVRLIIMYPIRMDIVYY